MTFTGDVSSVICHIALPCNFLQCSLICKPRFLLSSTAVLTTYHDHPVSTDCTIAFRNASFLLPIGGKYTVHSSRSSVLNMQGVRIRRCCIVPFLSVWSQLTPWLRCTNRLLMLSLHYGVQVRSIWHWEMVTILNLPW